MRNLKTIQHEIENVIQFSQDYDFSINAKEIVEEWYKAKAPYIKLFDGETSILIKEDLEVFFDDEKKERQFKNFLEEIYNNKEICECKAADNTWFVKFLEANKEGFFKNRVITDNPTLKIKKGMKLSKAFKYFISDGELCREIQDLASRYIQPSKITGDLYLSVDPLDFLTVSENNNNWRSCHSLDGQYRAGNLNYMLDDTTLVAYLAPKEPTQLKSFPKKMLWNNKKWRMLIHTNQFKSVCYYNRQYPFDDDTLLEWVGSEVAYLSHFRLKEPHRIGFKMINMGEKTDTALEYNYILGEQSRVYDSREVIDDSEALGYTDLKYSPHYNIIASTKGTSFYKTICESSENMEEWDDAFHQEFDITIGRKCKCLKCGSRYIERENSFLCEWCIAEEDLDEDVFFRCEQCGRRFYDNDEVFELEGVFLCKECWEQKLYLTKKRYIKGEKK